MADLVSKINVFFTNIVPDKFFIGPKVEFSELNESNEEVNPITKPSKSDVEPIDNDDGNINFYSRRIVCINGQCEITVCVNGKCKKETKNSNK